MRPRELPVALLVLRGGLGVFLLLWSIDKLVAPEQTAKIFQFFYKTPLPVSFAPAVGALEAALSLALLAGLWKTWTYGAALAIHAISTLSTWKQLAAPFGENHLFLAAIPVLAGFRDALPPAPRGHPARRWRPRCNRPGVELVGRVHNREPGKDAGRQTPPPGCGDLRLRGGGPRRIGRDDCSR